MVNYKKYPKYKNSGVSLLGDIPEHWEVWKISRAIHNIGSGTTPSISKKYYYKNGNINWINASYFAFTATPKNKTLELFGVPFEQDGKTKYRAFHLYSMKQAIEEGFIKDVLLNYTTYQSFYALLKKIENDPEYEKKKAQKKLKAFVEGHDHAIKKKSKLMIDHFM